MTTTLKAPFPWFGGKSSCTPLVWRLFGNPCNYVEPFAGSLAVLLGRPAHHRVHLRTETVNDLDGYLANFWRAVQADPDAVATWALQPVNEIDLLARHRWLCERERKATHIARMEADPHYYDPKIAGWWVYGLCCWIGTGWCSGTWDADADVRHQLPSLGSSGMGVHRKLPSVGSSATDPMDPAGHRALFLALQARLRTVRVACGDWTRVLSPSILGLTSHLSGGAVFLDPPYCEGDMEYATGADSTVAHAAAEWAFAHGDDPSLRIVLCGYDGHYTPPPGWRSYPWTKTRGGGYENQSGKGSQRRERLFASPGCLHVAASSQDFFAGVAE